MAEYIVFIRIEAAHIAGKGADREQAISIRDPGSHITESEKKKCVILKVEMTKAEATAFHKKIRPKSHYIPLTSMPDPALDPNGYLAWELAYNEELNKKPNYGQKVDFAVLFTPQQIIKYEDLSQKVEPVVATKAVFETIPDKV